MALCVCATSIRYRVVTIPVTTRNSSYPHFKPVSLTERKFMIIIYDVVEERWHSGKGKNMLDT